MIQTILEVIKGNITREKVLLCPDTASAKFIQRQLAKLEKGIVNLKFETVAGFISRTIGFLMIEKKKRVLKPGEGLLIMHSLVRKDGYFAATRDMPGFMQALWQSVQQIRQAGIKTADLTAETLGSPKKAAELSDLLKCFAAHSRQNNLYDYARILSDCKLERSLEKTSSIILLPGNLPLMPDELEILKMAGNQLVHLPWTAPADLKLPLSWRSELRRTLPAGRILPAGKLNLFCATEPIAEIREIIRRIRSSGSDFEDIAIVPAENSGAALIMSQLDVAGIPAANSLPRMIDEFRPGRLALNLCRWVSNDFPVEGLVAMLNQGDMRLFRPLTKKQRDAGKSSISSQKIISLLRRSHVRGGRNGYKEPILALGERNASSGKPEKLRTAKRVVKKINNLINSFPPEMAPCEAANAIKTALAKYTRISGTDDSRRLAKIKKQLQQYPEFAAPRLTAARAMWWLGIVLAQISEGEQFKPDGKVLITTPQAATLSQRKIIFFPGMTHAAIPGKPSCDPVIPDSCRKLLPPLKTAAESRLERTGQLYSAWAEIHENCSVCISMPLIDADGSATSPAEPFTRALKQINSHDLPLKGFFVDSGNEAADVSEWLWQQQKRGCSPDALRELFENSYPSWKKHSESQSIRATGQNPSATGLSGWNPALWDYRNNPQRSLSASGIDELSGCQFAYFLNNVINCMPAEQIDTTGQRQAAWLDAVSRGSLLHEVYEVFLAEAGWPVTAEHRQLLERTVDQLAEKYRILVPPASYAAFVVGRDGIRRDSIEFFERECAAAASGKSKPVCFELSFGMPQPDSSKNSQQGFDSEKPVPFKMASGCTVNLKGKIDRIDETAAGLRIWDYKTGSARNYHKGGSMADQAELQLAIYKYAIDRILERSSDKRRSTGAGLYFPTVAGQGQRVVFESDRAEEIIDERLEGLFDFLTNGRFPAQNSCNDCKALNICPYARILLTESSAESAEE